MKSDKKQTLVLTGIALLIVAGIMLYVTLSAPRVYKDSDYRYTTKATTQSIRVDYPLNLNTATKEELATIDGLNEKKAALIVAYREVNGDYKDVSDIKNISGIGETTYFNIAPYLTV